MTPYRNLHAPLRTLAEVRASLRRDLHHELDVWARSPDLDKRLNQLKRIGHINKQLENLR